MRGSILKAVAVLAGVCVIATGALAAGSEQWKIARTPAGNAKAKSEVLRRSDLGSHFTGGAKRPNLTSTMKCSNYHPRQSDLTVIGAARSVWEGPVEVDDQATFLRTARMVRLDWKRTVTAPQVLPCLREGFKHKKHFKLISLERTSFPHLTSMTRAYRVVVDFAGPSGTVRIESDLAAIGGGRSELTISTVGPASMAGTIRKTERRLARIVAGRLKR